MTTVWGKLIILLGVAAAGLWNFKPEMLVIEGVKEISTNIKVLIFMLILVLVVTAGRKFIYSRKNKKTGS